MSACWRGVEPLLPRVGGAYPGRKRLPDRQALQGILFVLHTGIAWRVHYLYLSFTNASTFSAADTLPLTAKAKLLMLLQSSISIVTLVLVAAREVNILG